MLFIDRFDDTDDRRSGAPAFPGLRDDLVRCDHGGVDQGLMCDTLGFPKPYVFERYTLGLTSVS